MSRKIIFLIVFVLCVYWSNVLMAKEFHYPGEELNGTWQVVKHDYRGVKDMNSLEVKQFFDSLSGSRIFQLPDGQKIAFWMTGESHVINPYERPRSGMDIGMKLVFPLDKRLCKTAGWDYLCDEQGNFKFTDPDIKKNIKDNAYITTNTDEGMLNHNLMSVVELTYMKSHWPNIKNYSYNINLNDGDTDFDVYPMKDNNELLIRGGWSAESEFILILKRIK